MPFCRAAHRLYAFPDFQRSDFLAGQGDAFLSSRTFGVESQDAEAWRVTSGGMSAALAGRYWAAASGDVGAGRLPSRHRPVHWKHQGPPAGRLHLCGGWGAGCHQAGPSVGPLCSPGDEGRSPLPLAHEPGSAFGIQGPTGEADCGQSWDRHVCSQLFYQIPF